jgi:hypothetical protein
LIHGLIKGQFDSDVWTVNVYTILVNGHGSSIGQTEVVTADNQFEFKRSPEHVVTVFTAVRERGLRPSVCGVYDYVYARLSASGAIDIDQALPAGRYIVMPAGARKEIVHEVPAFDDKTAIPFDVLAGQLDPLVSAGVTALHISGIFDRTSLFDLATLSDHTTISRSCGGLESFKAFCERAKSLGLRVLVDFLPVISLAGASRRYMPFSTLTVDARGRCLTAAVPDTELLLLNFRVGLLPGVRFALGLGSSAEREGADPG